MKKILCIMVFCMILIGCKPESNDTIIHWYVDDNMFVQNEEINYEKPIVNKYISAYNHELKKKGYSFQIEVYYIDLSSYRNIESKETLISKIEKDHPEADVVSFFDAAIDHYEILDSYFETDIGKKLKMEIPKNCFLNNQINGHSYSIEKNTFKYAKSAYSFLPEYYSNYKDVIEKYKNDPIHLLNELTKKNDWNDEQLITYNNGFDLYTLLEQDYQSITFDNNSTGLFIRRDDKKVVSPFDDQRIIDTIQLCAKLGKENAYGRELSQTQLEKISLEGKYLMEIYPYEYPIDLYVNDSADKNRQVVRYGRDKLLNSGKLSILKSSDNKKEAFLSIALMNIDKECANAIIYGKSIEDEQTIVKCNTSGLGGNWNSYGNYLIANQAENEPKNKKELAFEYVEKVDMDQQINPNFILDDKVKIADYLVSELSGSIQGLAVNDAGYDEIQIIEELNQLEAMCNESGMVDLINYLQKQLDQRN